MKKKNQLSGIHFTCVQVTLKSEKDLLEYARDHYIVYCGEKNAFSVGEQCTVHPIFTDRDNKGNQMHAKCGFGDNLL